MDKISVVTSLYRSSKYIRDFHARHVAAFSKLPVDYEFIFVNDGSPDDSAAVARELIQSHPKIKLVDLSRNFGQHAAMFAGMAVAEGNLVWALDSDLEEDPENIAQFYDYKKNHPDVDVIYGVIQSRSGSFDRNILGSVFYSIIDLISEVKIPRDQAWQRLMTKEYVAALLSHKETESLPAGLMILAGFYQVPLTIIKEFKGTSSYDFRKRLKLAVNSIIAFSSKPLIFISLLGLAITAVSFLVVAILIARKFTSSDYQAGWASLIASIWLVGGMILSALGIIGLYISKIFNQTKNRPQYIVRSITSSR